MKVIIAGSRQFDDFEMLTHFCDKYFHGVENIEIFSGNSKGADLLGEKYAAERGYPVRKFLPDWVQHKRGGGHRRNEEMVRNADLLIAFWDGKTKGTGYVVGVAKKKGIRVEIIDIEIKNQANNKTRYVTKSNESPHFL